MSIDNNARFWYWIRWKVLSSNILRRLEECKYAQEKIKFENYTGEELDGDSDNDNE